MFKSFERNNSFARDVLVMFERPTDVSLTVLNGGRFSNQTPNRHAVLLAQQLENKIIAITDLTSQEMYEYTSDSITLTKHRKGGFSITGAGREGRRSPKLIFTI